MLRCISGKHTLDGAQRQWKINQQIIGTSLKIIWSLHSGLMDVVDEEQLGSVVAEHQLLPLLGHLLSRPARVVAHSETDSEEQPGQAVDEVRQAPLLSTTERQVGKPSSCPTCTFNQYPQAAEGWGSYQRSCAGCRTAPP